MIRQPRRGLQSIKTRIGGVGPTSESTARHSVYLKLAMLEMERERRAKEQVASAAKSAQLATRMVEIESEVVSLQKLLPTEAGAPAEARVEAAQDDRPRLPRRTNVFRF